MAKKVEEEKAKKVKSANKDVKEKKAKLAKNTKKVKDKKPKEKKVKKESYVKGIKKELKLVKWPDAKEIVKYTIATIVFCIILVAFFELLNVILAYIKGLFN